MLTDEPDTELNLRFVRLRIDLFRIENDRNNNKKIIIGIIRNLDLFRTKTN